MVATSAAVFNGVCGSGSDSDSDFNSDDLLEYYQLISTLDNGGDEDVVDKGISSDLDPIHNFHRLPNDLSSLDLSNDDREDHEEEEAEEEATELERLMEVERAFREDERRRNTPLTAENTVRVVEAMQRVSSGGDAPDWAVQVPEDQWIDRIWGLRGPSSN